MEVVPLVHTGARNASAQHNNLIVKERLVALQTTRKRTCWPWAVVRAFSGRWNRSWLTSGRKLVTSICEHMQTHNVHRWSDPSSSFFEILLDLHWTKWYLITSQTRVKRVNLIHHQTILKRVWPMMHLHPRCLDRPLGPSLAARNRLSLSLPLSFSSSSYFLSFSIQKRKLPGSHRLMASSISVLSEPERVNLVVQALKPDYLLLDIFLRLRSETWTQ